MNRISDALFVRSDRDLRNREAVDKAEPPACRSLSVIESLRNRGGRRRTIMAAWVLGLGAVPAQGNDLPPEQQAFLKEHCLSCHGPEKQKGKFRIDTLGELGAGQDLKHWQDMLDRMTLEEMPPEDEPQPPADEARAMREWLTGAIGEAIVHAAGNEVVLRRLNRNDYDRTIRENPKADASAGLKEPLSFQCGVDRELTVDGWETRPTKDGAAFSPR